MGEKRPAEDVGMGGREVKKVKKVAEMVLVLAGMGKMRGGRLPSEAERELMAEAREKLVELCVAFSPKDVFPRNAFGGVIDDFGFCKLEDQQRLGFRPPKISIVEKLLLSKRKFQMEKSEDFTKPTVTSSQRMQASLGSSINSRGSSHTARLTPCGRPTHVQISPATHSAALGQIAATNSTSLPYHLPTSEVRSIMSNPLPSSHTVKDSSATFPSGHRPHLRVDGRPNGSSHTSQAQGQAHSSADHTTVRTPTWSVQPQFVSEKMASHNTMPLSSNKVKGHADVKSGGASISASSKPPVTQTTTVNAPIQSQNSQGLNFVQTPATRNTQASPTRDTHAEISKIIQKLLQPQQPECTTWIPQSKDYMNNTVTCQICRSATVEVDNILICDHCEKGFHLKCLQTTNQKGLPKDDWHCLRCLFLSNGKPLPPKYGRVMRNNNTVCPSSDGKTAALDEKINQLKTTTNSNMPMQNAAT